MTFRRNNRRDIKRKKNLENNCARSSKVVAKLDKDTFSVVTSYLYKNEIAQLAQASRDVNYLAKTTDLKLQYQFNELTQEIAGLRNCFASITPDLTIGVPFLIAALFILHCTEQPIHSMDDVYLDLIKGALGVLIGEIVELIIDEISDRKNINIMFALTGGTMLGRSAALMACGLYANKCYVEETKNTIECLDKKLRARGF